MSGRSCFVTGGDGFLGAWLVKALVERGDRVTVLRRDRLPVSTLGLLGLDTHVTTVDGDVCDSSVLDRTLGEYAIDTVFHLAAQTIVQVANCSPLETFETNVRGTWTMLEAVRRHGTARTVVASSDKAYGHHATLPYLEDGALEPTYPYDVSKAAADMVARSYWHTFGVPVAVTRCSNLYGGGDLNASRLVPETVVAALTGRPPVVRSDGSPMREFLYVEDAVAAYLAVADGLDSGATAGEAFNVGGGRPATVAEVVAMILRLAGRDTEAEVVGTGTPHGEIERQAVGTAKIRERCGWMPTVDLEDGMARTIEWYRAHPEALSWLSGQPGAELGR